MLTAVAEDFLHVNSNVCDEVNDHMTLLRVVGRCDVVKLQNVL
jgi:hypothetical protein